jgi:hypothetical protein
MRSHRIPLILTGMNLVLLVWIIMATSGTAAGQSAEPAVAQVLRANAIELVDAAGTVRAHFIVTPEGETLLRMRDANGEMRVKLGASEEGSGLVMADQSTQPGLHVLAKRGSTVVTLTDTNGQQRVLRPSDP